MSSFQFCLSAAKNLSSFQLLPASLMTDLLQLFLGLPLFLLPWGFHNRAAFDISPSSFLNVWPIHLNFLFLISRFISSWSVTVHKSLLEIMFGHHILKMYLRHRLTKTCILRRSPIYVTLKVHYRAHKSLSPNVVHPSPYPLPRLGLRIVPFAFSYQNFVCIPDLSHACCIAYPSHSLNLSS